MDDIGKIKKQVAVYGFAFIVLCQIVSFFIIGFDAVFSVFLLAGLLAGIINFNIIAFFLKKMLDSGNAALSTLSLVIRILIYCAVFFIAVKQGTAPAFACLMGFLAPKLPLYYFYAVKPDFNTKRKVRPEVREMYEAEDREEDERWSGKEE